MRKEEGEILLHVKLFFFFLMRRNVVLLLHSTVMSAEVIDKGTAEQESWCFCIEIFSNSERSYCGNCNMF